VHFEQRTKDVEKNFKGVPDLAEALLSTHKGLCMELGGISKQFHSRICCGRVGCVFWGIG
jgi:hypothetical protein